MTAAESDPTFVPLPADDSIPLADDQLTALFPGDAREFVRALWDGSNLDADDHLETVSIQFDA